MRKIAIALTTSLLFAACGGSSNSDTAPSNNGIPLAEVPAALAKSACDVFARCNKLFYPIVFAVTDCTATVTAQFTEATFNDLERVVTDGTANYNALLGKQCVDAVEAGDCSVFDNNLPAACRQAFTGTVAAGGDCTMAQECSDPDSRCDTSAGVCPGKCAPRSSAGVDCQVNEDCALGLVCAKLTSKCTAPPKEGEPCGGTVNEDCAGGLICVGDDKASMTPGACQSQDTVLVAASGSDCSIKHGPMCQVGLSCVITTLTADLNGKCQPPGAASSACNISIPSQCPVGQFCPLTLTQALAGMTANCTDLPAENDSCAPNTSLSVCGKDLICDSSKTCAKRSELGQTCMRDDECVSNHCINGGCSSVSACPI